MRRSCEISTISGSEGMVDLEQLDSAYNSLTTNCTECSGNLDNSSVVTEAGSTDFHHVPVCWYSDGTAEQ